MDEVVDYYQILHVHPDAPAAIIRASYRALMQSLKNHPDLGGDAAAAALINEAYATLSKPERRKTYDRARQRNTRSESSTADGPADQARAQSQAGEYGSNPTSMVAYQAPMQLLRSNRCPFCRMQQDHPFNMGADVDCERCQSPLLAKEWHLSAPSGKRLLERMPAQQEITLYTRWPAPPQSALALDVSLHGMLFETRAQMQRQQVIKISCALCEATGRVAHLSQAGALTRVGVEYVTLRFHQARGSFVSTQA